MPGVKQVTWNAQEENHLLKAIVVSVAKFDNATIAATFKSGLPTSSITHKINKLRKEALALGMKGPGGDQLSPGSRRACPVEKGVKGDMNKKKMTNGKTAGKIKLEKGMKRKMDSDDDDDNLSSGSDTSEDDKLPLTPETGNTKRFRASPRGGKIKNYRALGDPFADIDAQDEEGEKIFEAEESDGEDSAASDEEFGKMKLEYGDEGVAI